MTKDEALRMALEALEFYYDLWKEKVDAQTITAIREALAKPEQESKLKIFVWCKTDNGWRKKEFKQTLVKKAPLDTTPPQREWVGLTDEEIAEIEDGYIVDYRIPAGCGWNFAKDIEAKLKEKNGG